ncbi:hypothetical protein LOTGIDRAFT_156425 [Lottia gigantea]|uniref:Microtubule-associated protein 10 C-terminal domain-containing protein n=1 Tax=Lottia gigantea TaxID=225164 RepID=V4B848_LOTGI|nr:hypothetical protein LOTGIDRAFT_156425 [Lottia gigantea]ESP03826.1 hypothetical protein LOTGIDRAFT_156425 [Lottia gigantea]
MPVPEVEESLFSLELVIDKIYIPHVVCRFPAVAFRLLDFPTILINHVDQELGDRIKTKISRDSHYTPPDQFSELQDNHGNYMVKKGKSCLFKTSVDSLKTHLSNTPLYVMALDMFPDTPKLIGNSSVPLDSLMKQICVDIAKKGLTVPSVHGDKGLFKIYNLMGKEIGYIVLGFRLLCLGPSMAGHIPSKAATTNKLVTQVEKENCQNEVNVINVQPSIDSKQVANFSMKANKPPGKEQNLRHSQEMGSMTDAMTNDVLLQTVPTEEKAVHVVISEPEKPKIPQSNISTQTEKKRRKNQHILQKDVDISLEDDGANFLDEPNIFCPPPLFYNKYAEPKIQMERPVYYTDEESLDDLSETGSVCNKISKVHDPKKLEQSLTPRRSNIKVPSTVQNTRKSQQNKTANTQGPVVQNNPMFPILTALLNELVGIQGSQGLENVIQRVGHVTSGGHSPRQLTQQKVRDALTVNVARPTLSSQSKKSLKKEDDVNISAKNRSWIRKTPQSVPKTGKLTYRLTKTQKLRIAKSNPKWLQEKEKIDEDQKPKPPLAVVSEEDLSVTNFSDTLTEVRRLAQKELDNETLDSVQDLGSSMRSSHPSPKHKRKHLHKKKSKSQQSPSRVQQFKPFDPPVPMSSQIQVKTSMSAFDVSSSSPKKDTQAKGSSLKTVQSSPMIIEHDESHPRQEAMEPDLRRFVSESGSDESVDRSKGHVGVEVHLPKAPPEEDSGDDISLPDNDEKGRKMSTGLIEKSTSFRESILGRSHDSLDVNDDPGPLESTRTSQSYQTNFTDSPRKLRNDPKEVTDSKVYQSTTDNDTRQFMSTEEPELQELVSGGESESAESPRYVPTFADTSSKPSVIRSSMKFPVLNPISSEQSPIPATRKSTVKPEGRPSKTSENASSAGSSIVPTPRARRFPRVRESIHTESVSSYMPSEDGVVTLDSDANYSDDFQNTGSIGSVSDLSPSPDMFPRRIPSTKLGYTIS